LKYREVYYATAVTQQLVLRTYTQYDTGKAEVRLRVVIKDGWNANEDSGVSYVRVDVADQIHEHDVIMSRTFYRPPNASRCVKFWVS
jgi:hypothetical protein